jgi:PHD/YefM family antitoxin component YafN of YafNO toxin-antitoxin module
MQVISLEKTRLSVKQLAELAENEPVILTRNGEPVAAIRDMSGSDWESVSLAQNPRFVALIEESRRSYKERGGVSLNDLRKELGLPSKRRGIAKTRKKAVPRVK